MLPHFVVRDRLLTSDRASSQSVIELTMADKVDRATRSRIMAKVASKNTSPQMAVRRAVHAAGHQFRVHRKDLPGNPDLVFPRYKIAVFVPGCFWHGHACDHFPMPSSNVDYWSTKISRNVERDKKTREKLEPLGWQCRVIWECKIQQGIESLSEELEAERRTGQVS